MKKSIILLLIIYILFMFSFSFSDPLENVQESVSGTSDVKDNLADLTNKEKETLEELFIILQETKEMEEIEKNLGVEIIDLKTEIIDMETLIDVQTQKYNNNLNIMERVLKSYQRNGANTYLELILSSDNLEILLRRLNSIRDISRSTSTLLEDLEDTKVELLKDKEKLDRTLVLIEIRQDELKLALEKKADLKYELEIKLASLQEDKEKYEANLNKLEYSWAYIKPLFSETINMLVKLIEKGAFPKDIIDITYSLNGATAILKEDVFSQILSTQDFPTKVDIEFYEGRMKLSMPEISIYMSGTLDILDNQTLIFNMDQGQYLDMKLEKYAMEELFSLGYLEFNFKAILGKNSIKSIKLVDDNLKIYITRF